MNPIHLLKRILRTMTPSMRSIRVASYATFAFGSLAALSARSVHADVREVGLGIGHQLGKLEDLTAGAYEIRVNGAVLHRASAHTAQTATEVLDRYQAYCAAAPSELGRAMKEIPEAMERKLSMPSGDPLRLGIVREQDGDRGMVACFVEDQAHEGGWRERLRAFESSGDLAEFGHFRYAFVEKSARGGSHVVTLWTDGALNVKRMFPATGDAPGSDSSMVPRVPGSRRTFSASTEGYPAAVRMYELAGSPETAGRVYEQVLDQGGFRKVASSPDGAAYAREDGAEVFLSWAGNGDSKSTVTMVESGQSSLQGVRVGVTPP